MNTGTSLDLTPFGAVLQLLFGDAGNDVIFGDGVVRTGTLQSVPGAQHGNDVLVGGAGTDNLFGDGGNDEVYGADDNDYLYGDQSTLNRGILPQQFDGDDTMFGNANVAASATATGIEHMKGEAGDTSDMSAWSGRVLSRYGLGEREPAPECAANDRNARGAA